MKVGKMKDESEGLELYFEYEYEVNECRSVIARILNSRLTTPLIYGLPALFDAAFERFAKQDFFKSLL